MNDYAPGPSWLSPVSSGTNPLRNLLSAHRNADLPPEKKEKKIFNKYLSQPIKKNRAAPKPGEPQPSTSYQKYDYNNEEEDEAAEEAAAKLRGFIPVPKEQMKAFSERPLNKPVSSSVTVCPYCMKKFVSYRVLLVHVNLNHKAESTVDQYVLNLPMKQCQMCDFITPHYTHLKRHMILRHRNYQPFQCSFCDFKTSMQVTLRKHVRLYHSNKKIYECSECDFQAISNFSKEVHFYKVHMEGRTIVCTECNYRTENIRSLKSHIRLNHVKGNTFQCNICGFKTDGLLKLKKHIKFRHPFDKPYKCPLCGIKAADIDNLRTHFFMKHNEVWNVIMKFYPFV